MTHLLLGGVHLGTYLVLVALLVAVGAALCCMLPKRGMTMQCSGAGGSK